mgnify:CR=1 FL=1
MLQTSWAAQLDPLLINPLNKISVLQGVQLSSGLNQVNHLLGRKLQGWFIVRQRSAATFFDSQDSNPQPQLTLALNASASVSVDLGVF